MKTKEYYFRGLIERGKNYKLVNGYSAIGDNGGILYPWNTKAECRKEAKHLGIKAIFIETNN